jgi:hypothetical protein
MLASEEEGIMDWIEHLFHVSPDGGNGSLELLFFLAPVAAFLVGLVGLFWFRQRRGKRGHHPEE